MNHILPAIAIQLLFSPINWWVGAVIASAYYVGREMAQAEYRVINKHYGGKRDGMPWYAAFQPRAWSVDSVLDFFLPMAAVSLVFFAVTF